MPESDERDATFLRRALTLAKRGWGQTSPNPMVGAVVVRGDTVVGAGTHARFGAAHAEVVALAEAGESARGATLFVALEPCAHWGQTPPCTDAISQAGLARVVFAAADPNPAATGGAAALRAAGIEVQRGGDVEADAMRELNAPFFHRYVSDRPWVVLKLAISIDGAIADSARSRGFLTGPESQREVHRWRAGSDAIAVGRETIVSDDPALTVRLVRAPRVLPRRVVFDRTARLPLTSVVVRTARAIPTTVVVMRPDPDRRAALEAAGVEVLEADSLLGGLRALRASGVESLFVEGGARLASALLRDGVVDRLITFQAPIILGAGALHAFADAPAAIVTAAPRLRVVTRRAWRDDLMTIYAVDSR